METKNKIWFSVAFLCWLTTNVLFLAKYVPRAGLSPLWISVAYIVIIIMAVLIYLRYLYERLTPSLATKIILGLLVIVTCIIGFVLWYVNPMQIQVDRWSATTYFLDALVRGEYPYGVHTHLFVNNYPSPFPLWHYLQVPFWLMGDVGIGLICILWLTVWGLYALCRDSRRVLFFLLLFLVSPAYWWEVMTRSDGLSNALLVFLIIVWWERKLLSSTNDLSSYWWLIALIAGGVACTRLSAVIPIAIYLFGRYLNSDYKVKILFPLIVILVCFAFFAPYIFWDTDTWVFFSRNPFMSQSSPGNPIILSFMILIAITLSLKLRTFESIMFGIGIFVFAFMLLSQIGVIMTIKNITLFDIKCDISYLTLSFPYLIWTVSGAGTHLSFLDD